MQKKEVLLFRLLLLLLLVTGINLSAERKGSFVGVDTNGSGSKFTRVSLDPCEPVPRETSKQSRPN